MCRRRTVRWSRRPYDAAQAGVRGTQGGFRKNPRYRRRSVFRSSGLASLSALKAGADLVTVAVPEPVAEIVASYSPNLIVRKLSSNVLCPEDLSILMDLINSHDVVVMGMGLGRAAETLEAIRKILPFCRKAVLDADALSSLSGAIFESLAGNCELIVTPHAGEFARLRNMETPDSLESRIKAVREFSEEKGVVTLLKGKIDIISDGKQTLLNRTGNPGMTVGGTGDVLAGLTGSIFPEILHSSRQPVLRTSMGQPGIWLLRKQEMDYLQRMFWRIFLK